MNPPRFGFCEGNPQVFANKFVEVVPVNIDPIEILVREFLERVAGKIPMDFDSPRADFWTKYTKDGLVTTVHFKLSFLRDAAVPGLFVGVRILVFPWIDQMQFLGIQRLQNDGGKISEVDADFRADGILRKRLEHEFAAPRSRIPSNFENRSAPGTCLSMFLSIVRYR